MRRIGAVSALLATTEMLVRKEEVGRSFVEALRNALLGLRGIPLEMFASKAEASRPSKPSERTSTAQLGDNVEL